LRNGISHSLNKPGVPLNTFPKDRKRWVHKAKNEVLAARELADWLDLGIHPKIKKSISITGKS
jgi:hypothetical protein